MIDIAHFVKKKTCDHEVTKYLIFTCLEYISGQGLHEGSWPGRGVCLPTLPLQSKCQFKSKPTWTFVSIAPKVMAESTKKL